MMIIGESNNTYEWNFPALYVSNVPEECNSYPNCVRGIDWQFIAVAQKGKNDKGEPLVVTLHGTATVDVPTVFNSPDFIPFNEIPKEWCVEKTLDALQKTEAQMKEMIDARMQEIEYPKMRKTVPASWLPDKSGGLGGLLGTLAMANGIKMPEAAAMNGGGE